MKITQIQYRKQNKTKPNQRIIIKQWKKNGETEWQKKNRTRLRKISHSCCGFEFDVHKKKMA